MGGAGRVFPGRRGGSLTGDRVADRGPWSPLVDSLTCRGVAQSGSAPVWGTGGRRFKSGRPDQIPHTRDQRLRRVTARCATVRRRHLGPVARTRWAAAKASGREDPARDAASGKSWVSWGIFRARARSGGPIALRAAGPHRDPSTPSGASEHGHARSELGEPATEHRAAAVQSPNGSETPEMTLPAPSRGVPQAGARQSVDGRGLMRHIDQPPGSPR